MRRPYSKLSLDEFGILVTQLQSTAGAFQDPAYLPLCPIGCIANASARAFAWRKNEGQKRNPCPSSQLKHSVVIFAIRESAATYQLQDHAIFSSGRGSQQRSF